MVCRGCNVDFNVVGRAFEGDLEWMGANHEFKNQLVEEKEEIFCVEAVVSAVPNLCSLCMFIALKFLPCDADVIPFLSLVHNSKSAC